jgi:hypothetical protein
MAIQIQLRVRESQDGRCALTLELFYMLSQSQVSGFYGFMLVCSAVGYVTIVIHKGRFVTIVIQAKIHQFY